MSTVYIVFARFDRLSFLRQEDFIRPVVHRMKSFTEILDTSIRELYNARRNKPSELAHSPAAKVFCFCAAGILISLGSAGLLFLSILRRVFVNLLVGWKGLDLGSMSFMFERFAILVERLTGPLQIPSSPLQILLYPVQLICQLADLFDVDSLYKLLTVTCQGAKAPIVLFVDSFVLGVAILFIKSNYNFLWAITFQEMNRFTVLKYWLERKKICSISFIVAAMVYLLSSTNPFLTMLRFFLSFVNFGAFFARDGVTHSISAACVGILGFQNQELILVNVTSALLWCLILPIMYSISEIVCPDGGFTAVFCSRDVSPTATVAPLPEEPILQNEGQDSSRSSEDSDDLPSIDLGSDSFPDVDDIETILPNDGYHTGRREAYPSSVRDSGTEPRNFSISVSKSKIKSITARVFYIVWSYVGLILSPDLLIVYGINMYLSRYQKIERVSALQRLRAHQRWRMEAFQPTLERFRKERLARSRFNSSLFGRASNLMSPSTIETAGGPAINRSSSTKDSEGRRRLPPYYRLCFIVQAELQATIRIVYTLRPIAAPLSYILAFLGIGHALTIVGRSNWLVVIRKYIIFLCACAGLWTDNSYEAYDIPDLVREFTIQNPDEASMELVKLTIASRVILLQALGTVPTLISIIVVNLCEAPLFVFSPKLRKNIPPLLHFNSRAVALDREKAEQRRGRGDRILADEDFRVDEWVIILRSLSIFLLESRAIVFLYNLVALFLTIMVFMGLDISSKVLALLLLAVLPYYIGCTLISILYSGKRLNLTDEDFRVVFSSWLSKPFAYCRSVADWLGVAACFRCFFPVQRVHSEVAPRVEPSEEDSAFSDEISMPSDFINNLSSESICSEPSVDMEVGESVHIEFENDDNSSEQSFRNEFQEKASQIIDEQSIDFERSAEFSGDCKSVHRLEM